MWSWTNSPTARWSITLLPFAERDAERIRRSGQERLHAREVEHARALGEVLVDEVPVLAAELASRAVRAARLSVSAKTYEVSNRPCGSVPGPPKLRSPATIICGRPIGRVTPSPMPKSTGLSGAAGKVPPVEVAPAESRFVQQPRCRTMCVSLTVRMLATAATRCPNPGMLLPCAVGSRDRTCWLP